MQHTILAIALLFAAAGSAAWRAPDCDTPPAARVGAFVLISGLTAKSALCPETSTFSRSGSGPEETDGTKLATVDLAH